MVIIDPYENLPMDLRNNLETIEKFHSYPFWRDCADYQNKNLIHKVYGILSDDCDELYGFFSLRVNDFIAPFDGVDNFHFPILDISFVDFSTEIDNVMIEKLIYCFFQYIDELAIELSKKVGCRYIRAYVPYLPDSTDINVIGKPIFPALKDILERLEYEEWKEFNFNKISRAIQGPDESKPSMKVRKLYLLYMMRDLKTISES